MMDVDNDEVFQSLCVSGGGTPISLKPPRRNRRRQDPHFSVGSPEKLTEVETVTTEFGAKTMGFDPKTRNLHF
jgi:hypothetical protein